VVWIVEEAAKTVHRREVEIQGMSSFGLFISGVNNGEIVVTAGGNYLNEGQQVTLVDAGVEENGP
jgi:hypothetical protein